MTSKKKILKKENIDLYENTMQYVFFVILAFILTIIPIFEFILNLLGKYVSINENIYIFSFYAIKVVGFLIYFVVLKNTIKTKVSLISIISLAVSLLFCFKLNNLDNVGLDGLGDALAIAFFLKLSLYIYYIFAFILFIKYVNKSIYKKKIYLSLVIAIVSIIALVVLVNRIKYSMSIQKVSDDIHSINDFKVELENRNLYVDDYLLFGIDDKDNNIHRIDFNSSSNKKYPSYVYYGYNTNNIINENSYYKSLDWIIYYTNGEIYAMLVNYDDSQSFQGYHKIEHYYDSVILGEKDETYTYNIDENIYEISKNNSFLINELKYDNIDDFTLYIDILEKSEYSFYEYENINIINSKTLDNYANKWIKNRAY